MVSITRFAPEVRSYILAYLIETNSSIKLEKIAVISKDIMIPNAVAQQFSPVKLDLPEYEYICRCIGDCNTFIIEEITDRGKIMEALRYNPFSGIMEKFDKVYKNNIFVLQKNDEVFISDCIRFTITPYGVPVNVDGYKFKAGCIYATDTRRMVNGLKYYSRYISINDQDIEFVSTIKEFMEVDRAIVPTKSGKLHKPKSDKFVVANYLYEYKKKERLKHSQAVAILDDSKVLFVGYLYGYPESFIEDLVDVQGKYIITKERVFKNSKNLKEAARYEPGDTPIKIAIGDQTVTLYIKSFSGYYSDYEDEPKLVEINGKPAEGELDVIEQIVNIYPEADKYIIPEFYPHIFALKNGAILGLVDRPSRVVGKPTLDNLFIVKKDASGNKVVFRREGNTLIMLVRKLPLSVLERVGYLEVEEI